MADKSGIQWTDATWNPVTGCSKVSPGCAHCYAETVAERFWATQYPPVVAHQLPDTLLNSTAISESMKADLTRGGGMRARKFTDVQCHADRLDQPLRWKRPRMVFVNSMSDLFHEDVPDAFIDKIFAVMALAPKHTFQVLTKRPERMRSFVPALAAQHTAADGSGWPLPNVWLGVSVENQRFADERIPLLLQTPAAVRFISYEPALGPVDLANYLWTIPGARLNRLHWVIVGGESGKGARPFDIAWARQTVEQCLAAGVPVFVKQIGSNPVALRHYLHNSKGGDPAEWPEDIRVRQFPEVHGATDTVTARGAAAIRD